MTAAQAEKPRPRPMRMLELKAGVFVLALCGLGVVAVFMLGAKRHIFEHQILLHAAFGEIQGLKEGAGVRVAGVTVGTVSRIQFIAVDGKPRVQVDLKVSSAMAGQIRADSVARIDTQGLLGDKLVEITAGTPSEAQLPAGAELPTASPVDFDKLMRQASDTIERAKTVADRAATALEAYADPKTVADVRASASSVRALLAAMEKGHGLAHALFYDPRTANDLAAITARVNTLVAHVDSGVGKIDGILDSTDDRGRQLVNNLSTAAKSVGDTLNDAHRAKILHNVDAAASDLAYLTSYARAGKGSVGAVLIDPLAYERLISILGGVERSRTLRTLVRYAIDHDEKR